MCVYVDRYRLGPVPAPFTLATEQTPGVDASRVVATGSIERSNVSQAFLSVYLHILSFYSSFPFLLTLSPSCPFFLYAPLLLFVFSFPLPCLFFSHPLFAAHKFRSSLSLPEI